MQWYLSCDICMCSLGGDGGDQVRVRFRVRVRVRVRASQAEAGPLCFVDAGDHSGTGSPLKRGARGVGEALGLSICCRPCRSVFSLAGLKNSSTVSRRSQSLPSFQNDLQTQGKAAWSAFDRHILQWEEWKASNNYVCRGPRAFCISIPS